MTLTDFLLARIAEDEWIVGDPHQNTGAATWRRHQKAECEARRRIVDNATNQHTSGPEWDEAVRILASVYADHPDYREEWRP